MRLQAITHYSIKEGDDWKALQTPTNLVDTTQPIYFPINIFGNNVHAIRTEKGLEADEINGWRHNKNKIIFDNPSFPNTKPSNPKDVVGIMKAPLSTLSASVLAEVGVAMLEGALKYGRHNYRVVGVRASVYYDATQRHLLAWWEGEDIDPGSKLSHVTKAIASLFVLRDAMIQKMLEDDRPPASEEFYTSLNERVEELHKMYADRNPTHYTNLNTSKEF